MTTPLPSDDICLQYAAGTLDPALAMLVDAHLPHAPETARRIASFQRAAGALLCAEPAAAMAEDALDRALAALPEADETVDEAIRSPDAPTVDPEALAWRWAGPGRRVAPVSIPGSRFKTFALEVGPGRAMLAHSHQGQEWTLVLRGAYRDEHGEFRAGDFVEEDSDTHHRPVADAKEGCLCLAVLSEPLTAPGLSGVVARWLLG